jgi:glutamine amidotransferase
MRNLNELGLSKLLLAAAHSGAPLMGVCLGMQLLFDRSEELEDTPGLGLIAGAVTPLRTHGLRVPHIGWNEVSFARRSPLTEGLPVQGCPFYHVHSLVVRPEDPGVVVASAEYGERFATIVQRGSVFGVQFHPEKSSRHGLRMLENFTAVCRGARLAPPRPAAARA